MAAKAFLCEPELVHAPPMFCGVHEATPVAPLRKGMRHRRRAAAGGAHRNVTDGTFLRTNRPIPGNRPLLAAEAAWHWAGRLLRGCAAFRSTNFGPWFDHNRAPRLTPTFGHTRR